MRLKRLIKAKKNVTDQGSWKNSKMPRSAFPLSKQPGFQVRAAFRWRVVKFECGSQSFRLLMFYRLDINKFSAMLGRDDEGDMCVLARYEFHATHEGWHVHADCAEQQMSGRTGNLKNCLPAHNRHNRDAVFDVRCDDTAYHRAAKKFGLIPSTFALE